MPKEPALEKLPPKLQNIVPQFDEAASWIREGYAKRKAAKIGPPFNQPESFLKREAYAMIRYFLARSRGPTAIRYRVRKDECEPRTPSFQQNPFYWGMLAIDPCADCIKRPIISLYAPLLKYAHKHDVPPEYLIGFLYQSGNANELRRKLRENLQEKEFLNVRRDLTRFGLVELR